MDDFTCEAKRKNFGLEQQTILRRWPLCRICCVVLECVLQTALIDWRSTHCLMWATMDSFLVSRDLEDYISAFELQPKSPDNQNKSPSHLFLYCIYSQASIFLHSPDSMLIHQP